MLTSMLYPRRIVAASVAHMDKCQKEEKKKKKNLTVNRSGYGLFGPVLYGCSSSSHVVDFPGWRKRFESVEHHLLPASRHWLYPGSSPSIAMDFLQPVLRDGQQECLWKECPRLPL